MEYMQRLTLTGLVCWLTWAVVPLARGEESPIVARVNGQPIRADEVNAGIKAATRGRKLDKSARMNAEARVLEGIIQRILIQNIVARETKLEEKEIDAAIEQASAKTRKEVGISLEQFLEQQGIDMAMLRTQVGQQIQWERYAAKHLTDQILEAYFNAHRTEYDGRQVRVSHVLLRPTKTGDQRANEQLIQQAQTVTKQLQSGEITFKEAVERYSLGPSRHQGGDLGFIPRHGVMHEGFAKVAFGMRKGDVSIPLATPFGIHIIRVTEIKPGEKKWTDVRKDLEMPAKNALFEQLGQEARRKADVRFTGVMAHFRPGTKELVPGNDSAAQP